MLLAWGGAVAIRPTPLGLRNDLAVAGIVLLLVALWSSAARAQIDPLVQPRGVAIPGLLGGAHPVASITTGHDANIYLNMLPPKGPFDETQPAGVIRTTEPVEYYVRMYTPGSSNAGGPWIMRASTVRGLTPEQLRDRFALPFPVTYITNVLVPAGTCLMNGPAGPILDTFPAIPPATAGPWGNGGAQQTRLIANDSSYGCRFDFLPSSGADNAYINRRPIGANALWYAPVVGGGNAAAVGGYLDRLPAPAEYSDLFNVYNTLDVLNDGTATNLRPALRELTGESHAAAIAVALGATERFARLLTSHAAGVLHDGWSGGPQSAMTMYAAAPASFADATASRSMTAARWWFGGGGRFGRVGGDEDRSGYRFRSGQGILGYDVRAADWLVGAAVAAEAVDFSVDGPNNSGNATWLRAAAYGATEIGGNRLGVSALAGWGHHSTTRDLPSFARSATASYDGWVAAFSAQVSRPIPANFVVIEPMAGLSLVQLWRGAFSESGAGALSLQTVGESATKLTSRLGATLTRPVVLDGGRLLQPWLQLAWAHDFLDRDGELTASLAGATGPGSFTVSSASSGRDIALVGAGLKLKPSPTSAVTIAYDSEWGRQAQVHAFSVAGRLQW